MKPTLVCSVVSFYPFHPPWGVANDLCASLHNFLAIIADGPEYAKEIPPARLMAYAATALFLRRESTRFCSHPVPFVIKSSGTANDEWYPPLVGRSAGEGWTKGT